MFGSSGSSLKESEVEGVTNSPGSASPSLTPERSTTSTTSETTSTNSSLAPEETNSGDKRSGQSPARAAGDNGNGEKKRRSSGVGNKASSLLASAKNSLHFNAGSNSNSNSNPNPNPNSGSNSNTFSRNSEQNAQTPLQKLGKQDPALSVPQGQHNNSAGESHPGPRSTFRVGVWEDRNKKCRRTMEDTHAFLYNFLHTPAPAIKIDAAIGGDRSSKSSEDATASETAGNLAPTTAPSDMMETDNGYFAIFDGHAGTFAADWCGKKLHIILEEMIRKNPNTPIPELLDQTFTSVDQQLEKLPLKNSGCTAVTAVLRWEDRIPSTQSATGSTAIAPATAAAVKVAEEASKAEDKAGESGIDSNAPGSHLNPTVPTPASSQNTFSESTHAKLKTTASRQRVLYTANVGDARIVLCRNGKALRLSYDHKGSDENEGKRVHNAGGLILNNRVNGVLAVTRALGDSYMKDLVTGHPYTTETVIQPEQDEFIILACDGLWDVCSDQEAVDLVRNVQDPVGASKQLVDHALARFSTDNLSCMIVRFIKTALLDAFNATVPPIGVEGDPSSAGPKQSEVEKILGDAKRKVQEDGVPGVGVSGSNSGKGHDPSHAAGMEDEVFKRMSMEKVVEEEPGLTEGDAKGSTAQSTEASTAPGTRGPISKGIPQGSGPPS